MKKIWMMTAVLAIAMAASACGSSSSETPAEPETEATQAETETALEMDPDFVGTWVTGENEDTTVIQINEDQTWQTVNVDEIEGFEEIGGMIKVAEDSIELDNGDEVYDTVSFGAEAYTLYSVNGYTYTLYDFAEMQSVDAYVGTWVTGENEDTTVIQINEDSTWQVVNVDEIEDFDEVGGMVVMAEDSAELDNGDEVYDTVYFGAEENTLYSANGYTYTPYDMASMDSLGDFVGVWQTGENEDLSYLVICDDFTWKLLPADDVEGAEEFGGVAELTGDSLDLYNGDELYNTVYFGSEENQLYSSLEYNYELVSKDYNEVGE